MTGMTIADWTARLIVTSRPSRISRSKMAAFGSEQRPWVTAARVSSRSCTS
jgi:hypothetical protein